MKRAASALLLLSCSRHHDDPVGHTTLTSVELDAAATQAAQVRELAQRWNRALALHDATTFDRLYGSRVELFGVPLTHDQAVRVQTAALDADASFAQQIDAVSVSGTRAEFTLKYVRYGQPRSTHAWIRGAPEGDRWVVVAEGDDASDLRSRTAMAQRCEQLARRVALSVRAPSDVQVRVAATPPEFPAYAIVATNSETTAWYDVIGCTVPAPGGCVMPGDSAGAVTDVFTGNVLHADPNLLSEMSQCPY